jgi:uncharacterized protein YbaA (DUF1428 family)
MAYVDGFVLAVRKDKLDAYKAMAQEASKVWMEHGALGYLEAVADDAPYGELTSFPRAVQAKDDEIVVFAYALYKDRADRDAVMKKVMEDPRLQEHMKADVFDGKRMIWGGFIPFVQL